MWIPYTVLNGCHSHRPRSLFKMLLPQPCFIHGVFFMPRCRTCTRMMPFDDVFPIISRCPPVQQRFGVAIDAGWVWKLGTPRSNGLSYLSSIFPSKKVTLWYTPFSDKARYQNVGDTPLYPIVCWVNPHCLLLKSHLVHTHLWCDLISIIYIHIYIYFVTITIYIII
jgi:hypothetical protein